MATKVNSKLCQTFEMEFLPQIVASYRDKFRIFPSNYSVSVNYDLFGKCNGRDCLH